MRTAVEVQRSGRTRTLTVRGLAMVVAVTFGLAAAIGVAGAANPNSRTIATSIERGASCPTDEQTGVPIGTATFTRQGDRLTLVVELTDATPNTTYGVELWDAETCASIAGFRDLTTKSDGGGTVRGHTDVAGHTAFFATAIDPNGVRNDSSSATLAPLP